jgi:hypothetical protein
VKRLGSRGVEWLVVIVLGAICVPLFCLAFIRRIRRAHR